MKRYIIYLIISILCLLCTHTSYAVSVYAWYANDFYTYVDVDSINWNPQHTSYSVSVSDSSSKYPNIIVIDTYIFTLVNGEWLYSYIDSSGKVAEQFQPLYSERLKCIFNTSYEYAKKR